MTANEKMASKMYSEDVAKPRRNGFTAALNEAVPVELDLEEKKAVESITIPFHPGAAQYYKECGIAIEAYGEKGEQK